MGVSWEDEEAKKRRGAGPLAACARLFTARRVAACLLAIAAVASVGLVWANYEYLDHELSRYVKGGYAQDAQSFVRVAQGRFVVERLELPVSGQAHADALSCEPFVVAGWNGWDLARAPRIHAWEHKTKGRRSGEQLLSRHLQEAKGAGLNVVRTFAHTVDEEFPVLTAPGKYDEAGLRAIDFLLKEARRHNVRVILSLLDNWKHVGGVGEMVEWSPTAPARTMERPEDKEGDFEQATLTEEQKEYEVERHALFFSDQGAQQIYMDHVLTLLNRKNHYTGIRYKDDPTILAWNLINEPRCESWVVKGCEQRLQAWIEKMAKFVKSHDPRHLLTVGQEGFFAVGSEEQGANPAEWAATLGQNFTSNHDIEEIDFATVHIWPDTWNQTVDFQERWLEAHIRQAEALGKPLLLEEFGKQASTGEASRRETYDAVYAVVERSLEESGPLQGSLFWNWESDILAGAKGTEYAVRSSEPLFSVVRAHAARASQAARGERVACE